MKEYIIHCHKKGVSINTITHLLKMLKKDVMKIILGCYKVKFLDDYYFLSYKDFINIHGLKVFRLLNSFVYKNKKLPDRRTFRGTKYKNGKIN